MAKVDVIVVSFNSAEHLRGAVEPLCALDWVHVIVVDNASSDGSLETIADLDLDCVPLGYNGGFGHGCNAGWRRSSSPYVLFLNPDAQIDPRSLERLVDVLKSEPRVGIAAPKMMNSDGSIQLTQHRFPRLSSTYARAFFLHRLFPEARWASEDITQTSAYASRGSPDWVGGACFLIRHSLLERLGGFDEGFFHYCEDTDLCKRVRGEGFDICFEHRAVAVHEGGASVPTVDLLPVLAAGRVRYARKHGRSAYAVIYRVGIALNALSRLVLARSGRVRLRHTQSLLVSLGVRTP